MATVNHVITTLQANLENTWIVLWETLTTTNDTGQAFEMPGASDRSVQMFGTFGAGGTVVFQGSNDGGTTWATLTDPQGNAISKTAAALEMVTELTRHVRPFVSAGDGTTDLDVYLLVKRVT